MYSHAKKEKRYMSHSINSRYARQMRHFVNSCILIKKKKQKGDKQEHQEYVANTRKAERKLNK